MNSPTANRAESFGKMMPLLFSCLIGLLIFFSDAPWASAHSTEGPDHPNIEHNETGTDGVASGVDPANEESVRSFLLHARDHIARAQLQLEPALTWRDSMRVEGGDWYSGSTYLLVMGEEGEVSIHAKYLEADNRNYNNFTDADGNKFVRGLLDDAKKKAEEKGEEERKFGADPVCVRYVLEKGDESRWACAVQYWIGLIKEPRFLLAGFDHPEALIPAKGDLPYSDYLEANPPSITADQVKDEADLKEFVGEAIRFFEHVVGERGQGAIRFMRPITRQEGGPWKSGDIYFFMMTEKSEGHLVLINGASPKLEDTSLDLTDRNGCNVGDEIERVIKGRDNRCKDLGFVRNASETGDNEGFIEYLWENPAVEGDEEEEGWQGRKETPGISPKLSYIRGWSDKEIDGEVYNGSLLIFGAGLYPPEAPAEDDGGGCAVAGSAGTPRGALAGLLLIVSALFSAVWLKNRPGRRKEDAMKAVTGKVAGKTALLTALLCALGLVCFFSDARPAAAHPSQDPFIPHGTDGGTTAGEVDGTKASVKSFVLHARDHLARIDSFDKSLPFSRGILTDGGDWHSGSTYLVIIGKDGSVYEHGKYREARDRNFRDFADADGNRLVAQLIDAAEEKAKEAEDDKTGADAVCATYLPEKGAEGRVACAVRYFTPLLGHYRFLIAGLDHDEAAIPSAIPYADYAPSITADEVKDEADLKEFVQEAIRFFEHVVGEEGAEGATLFRPASRQGPWKSETGSIYFFTMTETNRVIFNGSNPNLDYTILDATDRNGCNVGDEIVRVILGRANRCEDLGFVKNAPAADVEMAGFVEYLWDDPDVSGDEEEPGWAEREETSGTSPKLSYVQAFQSDDLYGGELIIFGSGIYPKKPDDGGGCAVAGAGGAGRGDLAGLLLTGFVLFSAVWLKNRLSGKRQ